MKKLLTILFALTAFISNAQNTLDNVGLTSATPASVAYSLRQLSTSYTGPLVRVKVGVSFYDVYPDASTKKFSLSSKISSSISTYNAAVSAASADALSTIISGSTDATVAIWYDQSGNGVNVLSSSATPKIITAGSILTMSGQPTINFHNSTSYLTSSSNVDYSSQSWATVNAVAQNVASVNGHSGIISVGGLGDAAGFSWGLNFDPGNWLSGHWVDGSGNWGAASGVNSTDPNVVTALIQQDAFSSIYVNSVLKGTKADNDHRFAPTDVVFVGARGTYTGRYFIGNIAETIIFPKSLTSTEQAALESSQGIYLPQPPSVTITSSASGAVCAGTNITFTAVVSNISSPTYQWTKNGTAIPGANSSAYSSTTLSNNDVINVICGTASSIVSDNSLSLLLDAANGTNISGTTWTDLSGKGNHATLSSDQSYNSADGGNIQFNGGQNSVSMPLVSNKTTEVTMQTWVYLDANTKGPFFKNGYNNGYVFGTGYGGNEFGVGNKATMLFAGARWIPTTTNYGYGWKLVTMVINSSGVPSLYINNTIVPGTYTGNNALTPSSGTYLGRNVGDDDANWPKFNGKMGAAYFYTKALTLDEITQNLNATAARYGVSSTNSISSNTITTSISAPQVTITSSASGAVCAGTAITFTATVCGISSPTYQWTKNGIGIPGANSSTYSSTALSNNDQIKVWVNAGINNSAIVSNGLLLNLDASNPGSYSGTGNNWYDLSGNNNHATLNNSPTYDAASSSIVTNGTNQYLAVPLFNNSITNVTMQVWVYINTPSKGVFIANGYGNGYNIGIGNFLENDGSSATMLFSNKRWISNTGINYTSGWHLVTMVLNGSSTPFIYIDNALQGSSSGYPGEAPITPTGYLTLGAIPGDNGRYYAGKFAAAYFYDRALSLAEIQQNYDAFATKSTGYGSNTITVAVTGSTPALTVTGDGCASKTTLSTTSGLTSYAWYKDNVAINGATSNVYTPTAAGVYKVEVTTGSCSNTSTTTSINTCGRTATGQMDVLETSSVLVSKDGSINNGKGVDSRGLILSKPWVYGTVTTATGRIWLDRNLGATRVATSVTDAAGYGDYYQWGRPEDGHQAQYRINNNSSGFTNTKSSTSVPTNSLWIVPTDNSNDWLSTPDNTLWAGANPATNPCPVGFRIPTESEWEAERITWSSNKAAGAFASPLKLTIPGMLTGFGSSGATYTAKDSFGQYLTQSANTNGGARYFGIETNNAWFDQNYYKWHGMSVRCIKN
jgi:hypothetical protein